MTRADRILTLFLSAGKSLAWWQEEGVFSREILVYRELLRLGAFDRIQIFSYDARDRAFISEQARQEPLYARVDILAPASGKAGKGWSIKGVLAHRAAIARSAAIKTNQISGSAAATFASLLTGRPLVLRLGYVLSRRFALNGERLKAAAAKLVESVGARRAAAIIVTSLEAQRAIGRLPGTVGKIRLLPTYVDTSVFVAKTEYDFASAPIAVGRMQPQKNLSALLDACAKLGCGLTLVGKGDGEPALRAQAERLQIPVDFAGTMDNVALAQRMQAHSLFVLPSLHEGLPKVLIEAMATGLVCIGTPTPGTTDLIEDGVTGYLAEGFDADSIAKAIARARAAGDAKVGARARALIEARFGLRQYAEAEAAIFGSIA